MLRSVLAVLAGLVVILITSFGIEAVANPLLVKMLGLPNEAALPHNMVVWLFTFIYTLVCVMGGGGSLRDSRLNCRQGMPLRLK
jgi:hypothetical protein